MPRTCPRAAGAARFSTCTPPIPANFEGSGEAGGIDDCTADGIECAGPDDAGRAGAPNEAAREERGVGATVHGVELDALGEVRGINHDVDGAEADD